MKWFWLGRQTWPTSSVWKHAARMICTMRRPLNRCRKSSRSGLVRSRLANGGRVLGLRWRFIRDIYRKARSANVCVCVCRPRVPRLCWHMIDGCCIDAIACCKEYAMVFVCLFALDARISVRFPRDTRHFVCVCVSDFGFPRALGAVVFWNLDTEWMCVCVSAYPGGYFNTRSDLRATMTWRVWTMRHSWILCMIVVVDQPDN